jgi:hypothetical protein
MVASGSRTMIAGSLSSLSIKQQVRGKLIKGFARRELNKQDGKLAAKACRLLQETIYIEFMGNHLGDLDREPKISRR